ncbi:MAG TPA: MotA/TolQ/ExbB proton channel family protein [Cyclobacteriaceae bacterium]|nr:MotA/TolQ/ExbB proton channel family protein [Cyclobacteriaceae bacterium]
MKTMLASFLYDFHMTGGPPFMFPLAMLLLVNLGLILYCIFTLIQKKVLPIKYLEAIKLIGILAAVFGSLGTMVGLMEAFDALEGMKEMLPFQVIMGGMKVAIITVIYGLFIFCISMLAYIILKFSVKNSVV